jgi:hypothetical protein
VGLRWGWERVGAPEWCGTQVGYTGATCTNPTAQDCCTEDASISDLFLDGNQVRASVGRLESVAVPPLCTRGAMRRRWLRAASRSSRPWAPTWGRRRVTGLVINVSAGWRGPSAQHERAVHVCVTLPMATSAGRKGGRGMGSRQSGRRSSAARACMFADRLIGPPPPAQPQARQMEPCAPVTRVVMPAALSGGHGAAVPRLGTRDGCLPALQRATQAGSVRHHGCAPVSERRGRRCSS